MVLGGLKIKTRKLFFHDNFKLIPGTHFTANPSIKADKRNLKLKTSNAICYNITESVNLFSYSAKDKHTNKSTWLQDLHDEAKPTLMRTQINELVERLYLGNGSSFVDGHEYLIQQRFEVVAGHSVHDKAFQWRNCNLHDSQSSARHVFRPYLGGWGDWDTVCTDWDVLSEMSGFNSPGRPVDFVFGFQGCMLWD